MNEILQRLHEEGVDKVHEKTRIAHENIKKLLAEDYDAFSKVQFMGFVSIIEREYHVELQSLRDAFYEATGSSVDITPLPAAFVTPRERSKPQRNLMIVLALMIAGVIAYYFIAPSSQSPEPVAIEDETIMQVKTRLDVITEEKAQKASEANASEALNTTLADMNVTEPALEDKALEEAKVLIMPKRRVWMGLISQPDGKRIQKIIETPYELNTSKEWLIVFGHGHIDIESNNELLEFEDRNKLWFLFEGGALKQIDRETFKMRNQGRNW